MMTNRTSENVEGLQHFTDVGSIIKFINQGRWNLSDLLSRNAHINAQKDLVLYLAQVFKDKIQDSQTVNGFLISMTWWREWARYVHFNSDQVYFDLT